MYIYKSIIKPISKNENSEYYMMYGDGLNVSKVDFFINKSNSSDKYIAIDGKVYSNKYLEDTTTIQNHKPRPPLTITLIAEEVLRQQNDFKGLTVYIGKKNLGKFVRMTKCTFLVEKNGSHTPIIMTIIVYKDNKNGKIKSISTSPGISLTFTNKTESIRQMYS